MDSSIQFDYATQIQLAWQGKLDLTQLVNSASRLEQNHQPELAAVLYQTWLKRNKTPSEHFVCFNLGVLLSAEDDLPGAAEVYERAIRLQPGFVHPHFNLGLVYERQRKFDAALEQWRWVVENASPGKEDQRAILIMALNSLGRLQESRRQYDEALASLEKSLILDSQQPDAIHHWVFLREKMCLWPVYTPIGDVSQQQMKESTSALAMLNLSDDPEAQLAAAKSYSQRKIPANLPVLAPVGGYRHDKIRIAYCSSDFCLHPVAMLTVELFELHDRNSFEVYAFCWSPEDGSELRKRIIAATDHFIRIDALDDKAAAQLIRDHEIDILIDLHGQTHGARTTMLAYRPAPIQITYLGLPATTGLPCIDYVIADRFLIPEEYQNSYSEKPIYMPDVYQVSDRHRPCSASPTRESCGLPEKGFIFCSLNNCHKYTPELFGTWMRILHRVPDSVLWLLSDNSWAEANLRAEATKHGIDSHRLVFSKRLSPEDYLAQYYLADLFLDTFPFNAGTTANDALWMGLPVLTLTGRSFASRMAGALFTAAKLNELITYNIQDYESKAVEFTGSVAQCKRNRRKLATAREKGRLFDTPRFVRNLEKKLKELVSV